MSKNGEILHRSMHQALTQNEWINEESKVEHRPFIKSAYQKLGPQALIEDFKDLGTGNMLQYDP